MSDAQQEGLTARKGWGGGRVRFEYGGLMEEVAYLLLVFCMPIARVRSQEGIIDCVYTYMLDGW